MYLIITAVLIAGAFAIAGAAATTVPLSPWLSHVGAAPRAEFVLLRPDVQAERAFH